MAYEFSLPQGQTVAIVALDEANMPTLDNYTYDTHAPYTPGTDVETLYLSNGDFNGVKPIKHNAVSTVSYNPGESLDITSVLSVPVRRVLVGEHKLLYNAMAPVGSVAIRSTMDMTQITFFGTGVNARNPIEIAAMSREMAIVAASGLSFATKEKLITRRSAGRSFAA